MLDCDIQLFKKYVTNIKTYFEWGSGGSTYYVSSLEHIQKIYSVESDYGFVQKLKHLPKVEFIYCEMNSINNWGHPGINATDIDKKAYSNAILDKNVDFILVDGRFRVACILKCFNIISNTTYIACDDFIPRPLYNVILNYYDIVDKHPDGAMVILQKKNVMPPSEDVVSKYELIED